MILALDSNVKFQSKYIIASVEKLFCQPCWFSCFGIDNIFIFVLMKTKAVVSIDKYFKQVRFFYLCMATFVTITAVKIGKIIKEREW